MFDASAPGGETEGNVHRWLSMAIPSPLQFARQHVGLFRERYTQTSYSSPRTRRLELSITLAWSAAVSFGLHRCTLDWPTARVMRIKDPTTPTYIMSAEPKNRSWPPLRATAHRDETATAGQRPAHLHTPEHPTDGTLGNRAGVVRAARRTRFESPVLPFRGRLAHRHLPLQKTSD